MLLDATSYVGVSCVGSAECVLYHVLGRKCYFEASDLESFLEQSLFIFCVGECSKLFAPYFSFCLFLLFVSGLCSVASSVLYVCIYVVYIYVCVCVCTGRQEGMC